MFKGGTALRLCFYEDFRYSADLDFSLVDMTPDEAAEALRQALDVCRGEMGFSRLEIDPNNHEQILYIGPLGRERSLNLHFDDDERVIRTESRQLVRRYDDQPDPTPYLTIYALEEVAAEKLRCVIQRLQCRDISDLHRLLCVEGVDVDDVWPLFEEKARQKGFHAEQFTERLESRAENYERRWANELEVHLGNAVPHFESVMRELRRRLRGYL